jgi:hypothetical protein
MVGRRGPAANENFEGKVDHVRIYDYALTDAEILALPELAAQLNFSFTRQPVSTNVLAPNPALFTAGFTNSWGALVQWYTNDVAVPGAHKETFTIAATDAGYVTGTRQSGAERRSTSIESTEVTSPSRATRTPGGAVGRRGQWQHRHTSTSRWTLPGGGGHTITGNPTVTSATLWDSQTIAPGSTQPSAAAPVT